MIFNSLDQVQQDLLPIHPLPFPDELLSSWLVRLAHGNHFKVHTFCRLFIGEKRQIWNRDIDTYAPEWLINAMCRMTGLEKDIVEQTTLSSFENVILDCIYTHTVTPWILPLGIYHRNRTLHGLQYCPLCLKSDKSPYFRKQWRLSFYTVCDVHQVLMLDQCLNCFSPIIFHRNDIGFNKESFYRNMHVCHVCGNDLSQSSAQIFQPPNLQISQAFKGLLLIYRKGWTNFPLPQIMYAPLFLQGLRIISSLLSSTKEKAQLPLLQVEADMGIKNQSSPPLKSITFERRHIHERHRLLIAALWLLMDWPFRFRQYYKHFKLTKSIILQDIPSPPYFILEAMLND
ncbi:TniQ family protein [Acinetobacter sp. ACZLY 512]|uniref:TniQ family protein n=1 Tax=Acinetobacter sp. ACZLY 512 TaxID=2911206 RepID=UPI002026A788|nr:TniQ family protein [Acinetobacter sp. ACZLY 512]MCL9677219.1 TniQ family protein [Acinetobacter sp. ACZLY 512]